MKSIILTVVAFVALALMFPGPPQPPAAPEELCEDGKELMAKAGASYEQAHKMGCDHAWQQRVLDAADRKQHGS